MSAFLLSLQIVLWTQGCFRPSPEVLLPCFNIPKVWDRRHTRHFLGLGSSSSILKWPHLLFCIHYQLQRFSLGNQRAGHKAAAGLAQSHWSLALWSSGWIFGKTHQVSWQPGFCSLWCFLLLLIEIRSIWLMNRGLLSREKTFHAAPSSSTKVFLSDFFLTDNEIKISWVLIAPLFITNNIPMYWDASGSLIVSELKSYHIHHRNHQYSWKMYFLAAIAKKGVCVCMCFKKTIHFKVNFMCLCDIFISGILDYHSRVWWLYFNLFLKSFPA